MPACHEHVLPMDPREQRRGDPLPRWVSGVSTLTIETCAWVPPCPCCWSFVRLLLASFRNNNNNTRQWVLKPEPGWGEHERRGSYEAPNLCTCKRCTCRNRQRFGLTSWGNRIKAWWCPLPYRDYDVLKMVRLHGTLLHQDRLEEITIACLWCLWSDLLLPSRYMSWRTALAWRLLDFIGAWGKKQRRRYH